MGDNFTWQDGNSSPAYTIQQAGSFSVQVEKDGCTAADSVQVQVFNTPSIDLGADQSLCEGESTELEANVQAYDSFSWQDGSQSSFLIISSPGIYWLEAQLGNCTARDSVLVQLEPALDLDLPDSILICRGQSQLLQPKIPPGTSVEWQDGSTVPTYLVDNPGLYSIRTHRNGCTAETAIIAIASSCGEIPVFTPNVFTPNDDGLHDSFRPFFPTAVNILAYQIKIFDRWGALIFSSLDQDQAWDGSVQGRPAGIGVYVFLVSFTVEESGEVFDQQLAGSITLLR